MSEPSAPPRILAVAGSTRSDSYNKRLVRVAAAGAREAGAEVEVVDLREFPLPLFDEDLEKEHGMPPAGQRLKQLFRESDGFLIASPEYNSSITAVLKNAIDWVSRAAPGEPPLVGFTGKTAVLIERLAGGTRRPPRPGPSPVHPRQYRSHRPARPDCRAPSLRAFAADGSLIDPKQQAAVTGLGTSSRGSWSEA